MEMGNREAHSRAAALSREESWESLNYSRKGSPSHIEAPLPNKRHSSHTHEIRIVPSFSREDYLEVQFLMSKGLGREEAIELYIDKLRTRLYKKYNFSGINGFGDSYVDDDTLTFEQREVRNLMSSGLSKEQAIEVYLGKLAQDMGDPHTNYTREFEEQFVSPSDKHHRISSMRMSPQAQGMHNPNGHMDDGNPNWYGMGLDTESRLVHILPLTSGSSEDPDRAAIRIALIVSAQEKQFGVNMYESLLESDSPILDELLVRGYETDEAVLKIYESKYGRVPIPTEEDLDDPLAYHSHVIYKVKWLP